MLGTLRTLLNADVNSSIEITRLAPLITFLDNARLMAKDDFEKAIKAEVSPRHHETLHALLFAYPGSPMIRHVCEHSGVLVEVEIGK
jgi:hypothetical protein